MITFFKFLKDKAIHHQANSIPINLGLPRHLWSSRQGQGQWRPGSPSSSILKILNDMSTIDLLGNPGQWRQWWSRRWGGQPACLVRPHRPHGRLDELCQGRVGQSISWRRSTFKYFPPWIIFRSSSLWQQNISRSASGVSPTDSRSTGPTEATDLTWVVAEERTTRDYRGILRTIEEYWASWVLLS